MGQFYEWAFLSNRGKINQSPWLWYQTGFLKTIGRIILAIMWSAAHMAPWWYALKTAEFEMSNGSMNFVTGLLLCFMLPSFLLGFNTFAFLRWICFKMRLDSNESLGKEFIQRSLLLEQEEKLLAEQKEL